MQMRKQVALLAMTRSWKVSACACPVVSAFLLQLVLLSSLKTFVVSSNRFSGTVNENIYYLPALAKLDISNNSFVGTMVPAIG